MQYKYLTCETASPKMWQTRGDGDGKCEGEVSCLEGDITIADLVKLLLLGATYVDTLARHHPPKPTCSSRNAYVLVNVL